MEVRRLKYVPYVSAFEYFVDQSLSSFKRVSSEHNTTISLESDGRDPARKNAFRRHACGFAEHLRATCRALANSLISASLSVVSEAGNLTLRP